MSIFSENEGVVDEGIISSLIYREIGEQIVKVVALAGGANSKVYLAATADDTRYAVKKYPEPGPEESRDRLDGEFEALRFLWRNGIRSIPEPFCRDRKNRIGVFRYIQGRQLHTEEITDSHLGMVAKFIEQLGCLAQKPESLKQPFAAESCLRLQDYADIVETRLGKLLAVSGTGKLHGRLLSYLDGDFTPVFTQAKEMLFDRALSAGLDPGAELLQSRRVLSPSDLGFHNIIMTGKRRMVFIDFEYFGWDDPAKLVADFFLQPAITLPMERRRPFLGKLGFITTGDPEFFQRLPYSYLFSSLKWCLLVLNCYLEDNQHPKGECNKELLAEKFELSKRMLHTFEEEIKGKIFPAELCFK